MNVTLTSQERALGRPAAQRAAWGLVFSETDVERIVADRMEALETVRRYAALNFLGAAFEPDHMRAIANYCAGVLNGEPVPEDLDQAPEAYFLQVLRENGWDVTPAAADDDEARPVPEESDMKLFGETAPDGQEGYLPGAWDEVRQAYMDGHLSEEAYEVLRATVRAELSNDQFRAAVRAFHEVEKELDVDWTAHKPIQGEATAKVFAYRIAMAALNPAPAETT